MALIFDWCGPLMSKVQADKLGEKIERAIGAAPAADSGQGCF